MLKRKPKTKKIKNKKEGKVKKWWRGLPFVLRKSIIAVGLTAILTTFFVGVTFLWYAFIYLDDTFDLADASLDYTTVVYGVDADNNTVEIEDLHKSENRIWVDLDQMPENLQWAIIAIEDKRFYEHNGVDIRRTLSAVFNFFNPASSSSFGGSTITQQLIKNLTGDDAHTITRKIQEIRRAWYLEREYTKEQILETYLNTIYLSQGCYGVQTAANVYFGKDVSELDLAECATLAAVTNLPSRYDPFVNMEENKKRASIVLDEMVKLEKITEEEAEAAKAQEIILNTEKVEQSTGEGVQSYFVDQVIQDVIDDLMEEKGYSKTYATNLVYSGGLQIYSTMNLEIQQKMDSVYQDPDNFPKLRGEVQPQSAMVIIDNSTGAVVALSGGIGEKTTNRGLNLATQAYRQAGSSMKPIGTYAPAFEYSVKVEGKTISPGTTVMDSYLIPEEKYPKNYDYISNKPMTIQTAIARSTNTVASKVCAALGPKRALNFLKDNLGVTSLITSDMNATTNDENVGAMALGGLTKGISVLEITAAYAAFPNEGTYTKPYTYTKVVDQNGRVILEKKVSSKSAMSKETAQMMNMLLQYAVTSGTGSPANFGTTAIAGKTGTTNDDKDRWFVGYTQYYTAGVWYGYEMPETIVYSGTNPAVRAWRNVMSKVHEGLSYKSFSVPRSLVSVEYCVESGMLATENCPEKATGQFYSSSVPTETCTLHPADEATATQPDTTTTQPDTTTSPDTTTTKPDNTAPQNTKPADETKPQTEPEPDDDDDDKTQAPQDDKTEPAENNEDNTTVEQDKQNE